MKEKNNETKYFFRLLVINFLINLCPISMAAQNKAENFPEWVINRYCGIMQQYEKQITEDAQKMGAIAKLGKTPVERYANMDIFIVNDNKTLYEKMNKNALIWVVGITHLKEELPFKLVVRDQAFTAYRCVESNLSDKDKIIQSTFGKYQLSCFFFVPVAQLRQKGELTLDWNKNRTGFGITNLPIERIFADYILQDTTPSAPVSMAPKLADHLLTTEYGVMPARSIKRACDENKASDCDELGLIYASLEKDELATKSFQKGCDLFDGRSCFDYACSLCITNPKDSETPMKALQKGASLETFPSDEVESDKMLDCVRQHPKYLDFIKSLKKNK